jgi:hypothetical protein
MYLAWIPSSDGMTSCGSAHHVRINQPFAGSEHAQRNPCYTLLQNDGQTLCMLSKRCFIFGMYNNTEVKINAYFLENEGFVATYDLMPVKIALTSLS